MLRTGPCLGDPRARGRLFRPRASCATRSSSSSDCFARLVFSRAGRANDGWASSALCWSTRPSTAWATSTRPPCDGGTTSTDAAWETSTRSRWGVTVARPWPRRLEYRLMRTPFVLLVRAAWALLARTACSCPAGPAAASGARSSPPYIALIALVGGACARSRAGKAVCWCSCRAQCFAGATGVDVLKRPAPVRDVYWQRHDGWSYVESALRGSSYLKLRSCCSSSPAHRPAPRPPLEREGARIPKLQPPARATTSTRSAHDVPTLTLWDGVPHAAPASSSTSSAHGSCFSAAVGLACARSAADRSPAGNGRPQAPRRFSHVVLMAGYAVIWAIWTSASVT